MSLTVERLAQARALAKAWSEAPGSLDTGSVFLDVIEAYDELNNAITWDMTCLNCASLMDKNYEQYVALARINEIDPALFATSGRDFGRGFALAMRLVKEAQQS